MPILFCLLTICSIFIYPTNEKRLSVQLAEKCADLKQAFSKKRLGQLVTKSLSFNPGSKSGFEEFVQAIPGIKDTSSISQRRPRLTQEEIEQKTQLSLIPSNGKQESHKPNKLSEKSSSYNALPDLTSEQKEALHCLSSIKQDLVNLRAFRTQVLQTPLALHDTEYTIILDAYLNLSALPYNMCIINAFAAQSTMNKEQLIKGFENTNIIKENNALLFSQWDREIEKAQYDLSLIKKANETIKIALDNRTRHLSDLAAYIIAYNNPVKLPAPVQILKTNKEIAAQKKIQNVGILINEAAKLSKKS